MVMEELCKMVLYVRRESDEMIAHVMAFEVNLLRLISSCVPQNGRRL